MCRTISIFIALAQSVSLAQNSSRIAPADSRHENFDRKTDAGTAAATSQPSLSVSKTAYTSGQDVCGMIRITNTANGAVTITGIADTLEVHFFNNAAPPGLTAGSTPNWFKVADVPIALPGPIAPRATATINYCFSLCHAADYPRANSMRNVVTVSAANPPAGVRTFSTRSNSFPPPFPDCQACCLPDGSCTDTVPARCTTAGGLPRGKNTDCARIECAQACCHSDGTCTDEGPTSCQNAGNDPSGAGTDCGSIQCCLPPTLDPSTSNCTSDSDCCAGTCFDFVGSQKCCFELGATGCAADSECCFFQGGATCNAGTCCLPPTLDPFTANCTSDSDCCAGTCFDFVGSQKCCFELGATGCAADSECCFFQGGATCNAGTCCLPPTLDPFTANCTSDSDCCAGTCFDFVGSQKCCFELGATGCAADSECCFFQGGATCNAGTCCLPPTLDPFTANCTSDSDCCAGTCFDFVGSQKCCFELGATGCAADSECCFFQGGATCNAGTCCLPPTLDPFTANCTSDSDCCAGTCFDFVGSQKCCFELGATGCAADSECCFFQGGATCNAAGACCLPNGTTGCSDSEDCCGNSICDTGSCCVPQFRSCTQDSDCCSGLVCDGGSCEGVNAP